MTTEEKLAGGILVHSMWSYASNVLYPSSILKSIGIPVTSPFIGDEPIVSASPGAGKYFSTNYPQPVYLSHSTPHDHLVGEFSGMSEVYSAYVRPFSDPIFSEAITAMKKYLTPASRLLDAGCGPGRELQMMARLVPDGEVVGIDLAAGMVKSAHAAARARALTNCAFFQSDVEELPEIFNSQFDLVYNCLAHHHYPNPRAATLAIYRCLRPGGIYCVIDPGPEWFNKISSALAKWADPGWISFHTPEQFRELFSTCGFNRTGWLELLPGFGIAFGQKA